MVISFTFSVQGSLQFSQLNFKIAVHNLIIAVLKYERGKLDFKTQSCRLLSASQDLCRLLGPTHEMKAKEIIRSCTVA